MGVATLASGDEALRVHVVGILPGEEFRARLDHLSSHSRNFTREAWASLSALLAPSDDRVAPVCSRQGSCGGCALMHLGYQAQLRRKQDRVAVALARHPSLAGVVVADCVPSPRSTGYRNQAKYVFGFPAGSTLPVLGAFAARSHEVIDMDGCQVVEPAVERVRRHLLPILIARKVAPFDEVRRTGVLRHVLARATQAGQVMVTLVVARPDWQGGASVADDILRACPEVVSVVLNLNPTTGNVLLGGSERVLSGSAFIEDGIGDARVRLSSRSFFQTNRAVASRIYRDLVAALPERVNRAVDVYSGAGGIALSLAARANDVLAIEENPSATQAASDFFSELDGDARRVRVRTGDAAECIAAIEAADVIVLNPPRRGCAPEVLTAVARLRPRLVAYLSCDPETLARDLAALAAAGARIEGVTPHDMMPHTPHVETLAIVSWT